FTIYAGPLDIANRCGAMHHFGVDAPATLVGSSCLDDSTVVRLLTGQLDAAARSMVERELGRCRRCAALVAEVVRGSATLDADASRAPRTTQRCLGDDD